MNEDELQAEITGLKYAIVHIEHLMKLNGFGQEDGRRLVNAAHREIGRLTNLLCDMADGGLIDRITALHAVRKRAAADKTLSEEGKAKLHDALTLAIVWMQFGLDPVHCRTEPLGKGFYSNEIRMMSQMEAMQLHRLRMAKARIESDEGLTASEKQMLISQLEAAAGTAADDGGVEEPIIVKKEGL